MNFLVILAVSAGAAIAIQASMNAQLGVLLKSSTLSTGIVSLVSCIFTLAFFLIFEQRYPKSGDVEAVPVFLWFSGGALSAFGIGLFYYLIPKMGVATMMSYALSGQIIIASIASHYGWFNLPVKTFDSLKIAGLVALIVGVVLLNLEQRHEV